MTAGLSPDQIISIMAITAVASTSIFTIYMNLHEKRFDRDFQARQKAQEYYLPLYGNIAALREFATAYIRAVNDKSKIAVVFSKNGKCKKMSQTEILEEYKKSFEAFQQFYIEKKYQGFEIFISDKLRKSIISLWGKAEIFCEDYQRMENEEDMTEFRKLVENTTIEMECLFGLRGRWYIW